MELEKPERPFDDSMIFKEKDQHTETHRSSCLKALLYMETAKGTSVALVYL